MEKHDDRVGMASPVTANPAAQAEARVRDTHFTHGEVVALARLILRDSHLNVVAGSEWAYIARGHTLTYPSRVLNTWAGTSVVGAICQQMGEAQHTGVMGERALQSFSRIAPVAFAAVMPFARMVNELRVNRMHLERHPGSARFYSPACSFTYCATSRCVANHTPSCPLMYSMSSSRTTIRERWPITCGCMVSRNMVPSA